MSPSSASPPPTGAESASLAPSPTSPLLALRAAILAYLATDATLSRLMGGALRLTDEPPRGSAPVYALFGDAEIRDDSVYRLTEKFVLSQKNLSRFSDKLPFKANS